MESVLSRYRNLIILVGVLFLQVLGLAMQVKAGSSEAHDTRLIRIWAVGALTPFERGVVWMQNSTANLWHNYVYLRGVRAENRDLKDQIEQMRLERVRLSEDAAQAHRLQNLLAFKEQFVAKTVAAQVIGSSGSDLSRLVSIDKGENAGIGPDMPVITADGIVGKVLMVWPSVAQVLLINDQSSGVGAILEKSRLQGVLRGTANGQVSLEHVMKDEDVSPGETVLTSGGDQIFPKGLPVGTVSKVEKGKDIFLNIIIKPSASLSKLEEVLVLVDKQERTATAEEKGHLRAADILALRLPSVPDKPEPPATVAGTGATASGKVATGVPAVRNPAVRTKETSAVASSPGGKSPASNAAVPNVSASGQPKPSSATQKPKAPDANGTASKPLTAEPSITEVKPAKPPAIQPVPQPPADDNSPH